MLHLSPAPDLKAIADPDLIVEQVSNALARSLISDAPPMPVVKVEGQAPTQRDTPALTSPAVSMAHSTGTTTDSMLPSPRTWGDTDDEDNASHYTWGSSSYDADSSDGIARAWEKTPSLSASAGAPSTSAHPSPRTHPQPSHASVETGDRIAVVGDSSDGEPNLGGQGYDLDSDKDDGGIGRYRRLGAIREGELSTYDDDEDDVDDGFTGSYATDMESTRSRSPSVYSFHSSGAFYTPIARRMVRSLYAPLNLHRAQSSPGRLMQLTATW